MYSLVSNATGPWYSSTHAASHIALSEVDRREYFNKVGTSWDYKAMTETRRSASWVRTDPAICVMAQARPAHVLVFMCTQPLNRCLLRTRNTALVWRSVREMTKVGDWVFGLRPGWNCHVSVREKSWKIPYLGVGIEERKAVTFALCFIQGKREIC